MIDDAPELPPPTAQGTLAKTPLPHLLLYVLEHQLTGSLELYAPDQERVSILLLEGFPSKARTSGPVSYLGQVLVQRGILTADQLAKSMGLFKQGAKPVPGGGPQLKPQRLHGVILREMGFLDQAGLLEGLRMQVILKVEHLINWPAETQFAYFDAFDLLSEYGADDMVTVDPLPLVWAAIRQNPSWEHVHVAMTKVGSAAMRISAGAELDRLGLTADERLFTEMMAARPRRLHELTSLGTLNPSVKQLLIYCLVITKQIELVADDAASPIPPNAHRSGQPPVPTSEQSAAALARVQLRGRQFKSGDVVEERAPGVRGRDQRASSPTLETVRDPSREAAAAAATQGQPSPIATKAAPAPPVRAVIASPVAQPVAPPGAPSAGQRPPPAKPLQRPPTPAVVVSAKPSSGGPGVLTAELAAMRRKIVDRSVVIVGEDYFQMLGIGRDAAKEEIQTAFFALAKVWHPDRLAPQLADVRDACGSIFAHLSEAHQTLSDPERRSHYNTLMKEGGATPADQKQITNILEAATNFQKAEICLKRNDLTQAESLCRLAYAADPKQPEYLAMLAWLEAMKPENQSQAKTLEKIEMLDRTLAMNDKCERAYFYRGMLYKRIQNDKSAYKDFKTSAELNPRNIDSVREVRLFNMRRGSSGSIPPPSGRPSVAPPSHRNSGKPKAPESGAVGLFGRLFKK